MYCIVTNQVVVQNYAGVLTSLLQKHDESHRLQLQDHLERKGTMGH